eukprot:CAMPEP_0119415470 /NCGR_PEP_ID=MMETSP1335-20130426/9186_1 /TAXON_ID=259385 /ORGANISM="Chrysoculter rhomboideus, Strain RCC1486" /LENGTH=75 /DNA_ID=CAMNT_0007440473 /DNA_START=41 /DNA_END=268 /DNA_ORIENTATION=+
MIKQLVDRRTHVADAAKTKEGATIDELAAHMAATGKWNAGRELRVPDEVRARREAAQNEAQPMHLAQRSDDAAHQ